VLVPPPNEAPVNIPVSPEAEDIVLHHYPDIQRR